MSEKEKLGIEIEIDLGKAKEQIDKLNALMAKLGQSPEAAQKSLDKLTEKFKLLAIAFTDVDPDKKGQLKKAAKAIQDMMKEFGKSDEIEKFGKRLRNSEQDMDSHVAKFQKVQVALQKGGRQVVLAEEENTRRIRKTYEDRANAAIQLGKASAWSPTISAKNLANPGPSMDSHVYAYQSAQAKASAAANKAAAVSARETAKAELDRARAHSAAGKAAADAGKNTDILNISLTKLTARIAEFYSIRTVLFAVTNQIRDAVAGSLDFSQSIHDIAAISGASSKEMETMGDSILRIATHSRYSAKEVGDLMQILAQAGVAAKDMAQVSDVVGMFATASGATPQQAADVFTTALNVWEIEADKSTKVANTLTAALNNSKLEVGGLSTAFNYLASQAATFDYSLEETAGIIAGLSQVGVKASTIGTGVSQLLKELAAPKDRLKALLDYYKIGLDEINPRIHSYADIIQVFNDKNVAAEHILRSLDSRVGRSLISSMKAGADTFREMTASVTGTDAALIAYGKSMEGARAKINVIKQTFLSAAVNLGEILAPVMGGFAGLTLKVVQGLDTIPGRLVLIGTGIAALSVAMATFTALCLANPILMGVTVGVAAITGAFALFGLTTDETVISSRELTKELVKQAEGRQRLKDQLTAAKIEAESSDKALKKYNETVKKYGEGSTEASKLGGQVVKLTSETKKGLMDLAASYPEYFKRIDTEKVKYRELLEVLEKVNKERLGSSRSAASKYNELAEKADGIRNKLGQFEMLKGELGKEFAAFDKKAPRDRTYAEGFAYAGNKTLLARDELHVPGLKSDLKQLEDEMKNIYKAVDPDYFKFSNGKLVETKPDPAKAKTPSDPLPNKNAIKQEETYENRRDAFFDKLERDTLGLMEQSDTAYINTLKEMLRGQDTSNDDKKYILGELEVAVTKLYQTKLERDIKEVTDAVDAFKRKDPKRTTEDAEKIKQEVAKKLSAITKTNSDQKSAEFAGLGTLEDKAFPAEKMSLKSTFVEKAAEKTLRTEQEILNLKKEQAWTGEQINRIEVEGTEAQIRAAQRKKEAYQDDLKQLMLYGDLLKGDDKTYESIEDKLDSIVEKERELTALKERQTASLKEQFALGAKQEWSRLSDVRGMTGQLGSDLTNQAFNGITGTLSNTLSTFTMPDQDAIDSIKSKINDLNIQKAEIQAEINSITSKGDFMTGADKTKLNEQAAGLAAVNSELSAQEKLLDKQQNAWSRFKDGLKEIMQQILKTLQEYIIKLMVVKMVQSVIGMVSGSTQQTELNSPSGISQPAFSGGDPNYFLPKATGGLIPTGAGVPGKDSVPILAMPGEFIIPTNSVNKYGVAFFEKLRAQKFAEGGLVGGNSRSTTSSSEGKSVQNLQIVNIVDPSQIPQTTDDQIINVISYDMARKGQTYRAVRQVAAG